jgi:CMP/dCMP kinase
MSRGFVIAVDGPAASGKGTVAGGLARDFSLPYLDTGLLYRAVGVAVADPDDEAAAAAAARTLDLARLGDARLRTRSAGAAASRVAVHRSVRDALLDLQRSFAAAETGAVLDGRDIGTVIVPWAPAKLFVTASAAVRAERRWMQLHSQGDAVSLGEVEGDIARRDELDQGRETAPLLKAADAVLLDTTDLTIEQAADAARRIVEAARARWEASRNR